MSSIEDLKVSLAMAPDTIESCRVLLEYCFHGKNLLSEPQFSILVDLFGEEELVAHTLMYIYSMKPPSTEKKDDILEHLDAIYNILHAKFTKRNNKYSGVLFSRKDSLTA